MWTGQRLHHVDNLIDGIYHARNPESGPSRNFYDWHPHLSELGLNETLAVCTFTRRPSLNSVDLVAIPSQVHIMNQIRVDLQ